MSYINKLDLAFENFLNVKREILDDLSPNILFEFDLFMNIERNVWVVRNSSTLNELDLEEVVKLIEVDLAITEEQFEKLI